MTRHDGLRSVGTDPLRGRPVWTGDSTFCVLGHALSLFNFGGTECQQDVSSPCREVGRPDGRVSGGEQCREASVRCSVSVSVSLTT
jgi:hypothetical protein